MTKKIILEHVIIDEVPINSLEDINNQGKIIAYATKTSIAILIKEGDRYGFRYLEKLFKYSDSLFFIGCSVYQSVYG